LSVIQAESDRDSLVRICQLYFDCVFFGFFVLESFVILDIILENHQSLYCYRFLQECVKPNIEIAGPKLLNVSPSFAFFVFCHFRVICKVEGRRVYVDTRPVT